MSPSFDMFLFASVWDIMSSCSGQILGLYVSVLVLSQAVADPS